MGLILFLLLIFIGVISAGITSDGAAALGVQALDEKLRRETMRHLFIGRFMGNIEYQDPQDNQSPLIPSGAVIEVNEGIRSRGVGDSLLIPMDLDLTGDATFGDAMLKGREESAGTQYTRGYYNQIRKALVELEGMSEGDRTDVINTYALSIPKLSRWMAYMENWMWISSIYEGISENLSCPKADKTYGQGRALTKRLHPNMYYWSGPSQAAGVATRVGTANKFPTMAETYTVVSAASNPLAMSAYTLDALAVQCELLGIRKVITKEGYEFWPLLIHPMQKKSLLQDSTYRAALATGMWMQMKGSPLCTGAMGEYGGFVIWSDSIAARGFSGTATTLNVLGTTAQVATKSSKKNPRFLPITGTVAISSKYNYAAVVLGASAFGKAVNRPLRFKSETEDYENWKGVAGVVDYGYNRMDWVAEADIANLTSSPSSITGIDNKSSLICITWEG